MPPVKKFARSAVLAAMLLMVLAAIVSSFVWYLGRRTSEAAGDKSPPNRQREPSDAPLASIPGTQPLGLDRRLAGEFAKLDPAEAGWESEAFSDAAAKQLHALGKWLTAEATLDTSILAPLVARGFSCGPLRPPGLQTAFQDRSVTVRRGGSTAGESNPTAHRAVAGLAAALASLGQPLQGATERRCKFKIVGVGLDDDEATTTAYFQASGRKASGRVQLGATWHCRWTRDTPPQLQSIRVDAYEEITPGSTGHLSYVDTTFAILGHNDSYRRQLARSFDYWRARSDRTLVSDLAGHQGVAIGDVNGDGLDDLYVLQPGGLPNRLFLHRDDGTAQEASSEAGIDWLDFSRSALCVDLDNDGDQDLVIGMAWELLFMENDGTGSFKLRTVGSSRAMVQSLAAADYDNDGKLDVYICGRDASSTNRAEQGVLGTPLPVHDANNGGPSALLRNHGGWQFKDVTRQVGLDQNNRRFSYAAAWDDYDDDGDMDLYVANDFGRNNLYRNDAGQFADVAASAGVEDIGPGMSASWGDANGDGRMDIYVGNMFSSAGNRVTNQLQFMAGANESTREQVRRHSRGNSLFVNLGDGTFRDVTLASRTNMGRWAWGSIFVDLNNDGWEDLFVANGFITTDDTDDL